jgi:hypothetical protein
VRPRNRQPLKWQSGFKRRSTSFSKSWTEKLKEVADLVLDGLYANSGRIPAGMDLLIPRYQTFAVLMENWETYDKPYWQGKQPISSQWMSKKSDANAPLEPSAPPAQSEPKASQPTEETASDVEDLAPVTSPSETPPTPSPASESTSTIKTTQSQEVKVAP